MKQTALYTAFDLFPSTKGAATHIRHFSEAMFEHFESGMLYVLGHDKLPNYQEEGAVIVKRFSEKIPNYLDRGQAFSSALSRTIEKMPNLQMTHFRDIWGGLACLKNKRNYKTLFEVNGLPSIELPYRYGNLPQSTLDKLRELELFCLNESDFIITPSTIIQENLNKMGVPLEKIKVIPNGADIPNTFIDIPDLPEKYLLYFGALQKWQGVDILLKAFAGLSDYEDLKLVICSSHHRRMSKPFKKLAERLDIAEKVIWQEGLAKKVLKTWIKNALFTIAPLAECSRNLSQGCCPLKILESLAVGTPVIASDLPVVRELITDKIHGKLVRPGRPAELSRTMRYLLEFPEEGKKMGKSGQKMIQKSLTWGQSNKVLKEVYTKMLNP